MQSHTRAIVAAAAYAVITAKKVAGIYDHAADKHWRIAAECRGDRVQAYDGERSAYFGGALPDLYDQGDQAFVSLVIDGATARGYDRGGADFYEIAVTNRQIDFYDHGESVWFTFHVQIADEASATR